MNSGKKCDHFCHRHLYVNDTSWKKREKMESDFEKNADGLVNYEHDWKYGGFREIQLSVWACFGSHKVPSYL